jgi:hypothetical protein
MRLLPLTLARADVNSVRHYSLGRYSCHVRLQKEKGRVCVGELALLSYLSLGRNSALSH